MSEPTPVRIAPVDSPGDFAAAMAIREIVFIEEQRVPEELERDDEDPTAFHLLASLGPHAVGTGRLIELATPEGERGRWGQIGRMAVLVSHRHAGLGSILLEALEAEARRRGLDGVLVHAQLHAHAFYDRAGYRNHGSIFDEAGIPHVEMHKSLQARPENGASSVSGAGPTEPARAVAKKAVAKTPVAKTPVAKTPVAKTPVAKKAVAKTPVAKKAVAKKAVAKKAVAKKAVAKKAAGTRRR